MLRSAELSVRKSSHAHNHQLFQCRTSQEIIVLIKRNVFKRPVCCWATNSR